MSKTGTVSALLAAEDSGSDVLFERLSGSSAFLWPIARWPIARALAQAEVKLELRASKPATKAQVLQRVARLALPNPASADNVSSVEHLFVVSGTTHADAPRGVGNWLSDDFSQALGERAAVVQDAAFDILTPRVKRPANPRTWTYSQASARIWRAAQASPLSDTQRERATQALSGMFDLFGPLLSQDLRQRLLGQILPLLELTPHAEAEFIALLDQAQPRAIYMQMAAYGDRSNLIRVAHDRGISVAELQHGWIGAAHAAYNFGRAFFDSELTSSLPDTLFTFGQYWGKDLSFPGRIVPVGKPPLETTCLSAPSYDARQQRLLVISSEYETGKLIEAVTLLKRHLPDEWEVVLRPHPAERADGVVRFEEALSHGAVLDPMVDLNASLSASRAVVGMTSTVLFEALPFNINVGVIETDLAKYYANAATFPNRLDDEASYCAFARAIQRPPVTRKSEIDDMWHPNAVATFLTEVSGR
ncbi:hypothetical protein [Leucobacter sp. G161]|uniref:hypothetical protein n=1 Tax=Leucobacter sp. G161 TaxID=663704 RepID=UPI00073B06C8|nr:hypothetical protein [Leucobacter sp. G161]KUF08603.1 hypothetical protein AUL38_00380 [Leucobacter sp. G161]